MNFESSPIGRQTMSSGLPLAENYHDFIFRILSPYVGKRVWEIGAGYGQYTKMLMDNGCEVLASDIDNELLGKLADNFEGEATIKTLRIDLTQSSGFEQVRSWNPDTVYCLNVLEHIENDILCLKNIRENIASKTRAIFLTPAHPALYGFMDKDAGHYRRYTRKTLSDVFQQANWKILKSFYSNPIGGLGWFVRNRLICKPDDHLDSAAVNRDIQFFDRYCVPLTAFLSHFTQHFFGQSVIVIAEKE